MHRLLFKPVSIEAQQELSGIQAKKAEIEAQIAKMEQAIKDNHTKIEETNAQIGQSQAEVEALNTEIAAVQERITQRTAILKERAVSYPGKRRSNRLSGCYSRCFQLW